MKVAFCLRLICALSFFSLTSASCKDFVDVVDEVSQGVVAIGIHAPIKYASPKILATGFVVGDGTQVITNYHVVSQVLDPTIVEDYVVLVGQGATIEAIKVQVGAIDPVHDIAVLELPKRLKALTLANENMVRPGSEIALTGFPIGAVLGLYPATHRGYIAAVTPDAIPAIQSDQLTVNLMKRLAKTNLIYQLDITAYPGNSGSPVYDVESGLVLGVINKVLVRDTKESALSSPTGISYAIPVKYIRNLLGKSS